MDPHDGFCRAYKGLGPLRFIPNQRSVGITVAQIEIHFELLHAMIACAPGPPPIRMRLQAVVRDVDSLDLEAVGKFSRDRKGSASQNEFIKREAAGIAKMWRHAWFSYVRWPTGGSSEKMIALKKVLATASSVKTRRRVSNKTPHSIPELKRRDSSESDEASLPEEDRSFESSSPSPDPRYTSMPAEPLNIDELNVQSKRWRRLRLKEKSEAKGNNDTQDEEKPPSKKKKSKAKGNNDQEDEAEEAEAEPPQKKKKGKTKDAQDEDKDKDKSKTTRPLIFCGQPVSRKDRLQTKKWLAVCKQRLGCTWRRKEGLECTRTISARYVHQRTSFFYIIRDGPIQLVQCTDGQFGAMSRQIALTLYVAALRGLQSQELAAMKAMLKGAC